MGVYKTLVLVPRPSETTEVFKKGRRALKHLLAQVSHPKVATPFSLPFFAVCYLSALHALAGLCPRWSCTGCSGCANRPLSLPLPGAVCFCLSVCLFVRLVWRWTEG